MRKIALLVLLITIMAGGCKQENTSKAKAPFIWENANIYFLLTDRFNNGNQTNDIQLNRTEKTGVLRGFMGGDLNGITEKINEGYFNDLGITALWLTPFYEQIHGCTDEGTGNTYAFHGYWPKDFTAIDPNFGTKKDLKEMVDAAHAHNIRIVMDVIINHTGPVTEIDPLWGEDWVRTKPRCLYQDYESTIKCTLVDNLPDIRTESEENIALPQHLLDKWKAEGRLEKELKELDKFFAETGYPRAPKYYIIKWLTDYIREYGIDAYRLDTAKHTEEGVWTILRKEADKAYKEWKANNPDIFPNDDRFFMLGEVYNYNISGGQWFDYGDTLVNFYAEGLDNMINFEFKYNAEKDYEEIFSRYSNILHNELKGFSVTNYLASHDDGSPFDKMRERPFEAANKLLLSPGISQVYYGDETSRLLFVEEAEGDANLRSFMNWNDLNESHYIGDHKVLDVLSHYQKLGNFRKDHPAIGAGIHEMISKKPYVFKRSYESDNYKDVVIVGLQLPSGEKNISVKGIFRNNSRVRDAYSNQIITVSKEKVSIDTPFDIVLLEKL